MEGGGCRPCSIQELTAALLDLTQSLVLRRRRLRGTELDGIIAVHTESVFSAARRANRAKTHERCERASPPAREQQIREK